MNKNPKIEITKNVVEAKSRQLNATWTIDLESMWGEPVAPVDISKLTMDEQADLIVKKLSEPPKPKSSLQDDDYMTIMAKMIADEIDREFWKN